MSVSAKPPAHVADEEVLHRLVRDGETREQKPHYIAFYSSTEPFRISVDRAAYRTLDESLAQFSKCGVAALIAGGARAIDVDPPLGVESLPENGNDAHAEIKVPTSMSKNAVKTKSCVKLVDISMVVRQPPPKSSAP